MREIVNAILYQSRTGCQRDCLPHDLPPRSAAYCHFARWRDDGTDQAIHDLLRGQAREKQGRRPDPGLVVLDTQSVHAAASSPRGHDREDSGKKVPGRKRCLELDVLGLVVAYGAAVDIDVQVVERNPATKGFVPRPKRWVVEQAFGILSFHRRLVRDYEHRLTSPASRVYRAMTDVMARRLTGTSAPRGGPHDHGGPGRVPAGQDRGCRP